jgi:Mg2+ and Co2+ transporter CorA
MIREINLGGNNEKIVDIKSLQTSDLQNLWFELVDPTDEELAAVSAKIGLSKALLDFPRTDNLIDLHLEDNLIIINFAMPQDVALTKNFHPIVIVFSKNFLVTTLKKDDQRTIETAKERMSKTKVDPPAQVAFFILDEIVSSHFLQL